MRYIKSLLMVPLFLGLFATGARAADWFMGLEDYSAGVPSQSEKQTVQPVVLSGTLAAFNQEANEILVNTEVAGLLGPQEVTLPYKVGEDTTMDVCVRSTMDCKGAATGTEGLNILASYENITAFSVAKKDVVIIADAEDPSRIIHVQVEYEL